MSELAIRCRDLEKRYPPDVHAVRGVDLDIPRGECFGLLGPNGAGKTTTVEIFEGLLEPTAGSIEILGKTWDKNARELRQQIGVSMQETRFSEKLTVRETAVLFRSFYAKGIRAEEAIDLVGLGSKATVRVGTLSGGQRQRLEIACALVGEPSLLFMDEPTTGLDPQSRRQLWDVIRDVRAAGRTILITTHYMDEAERLCDRLAVIDQGKKIAEGSPSELIASLGGDHVIEFACAQPVEDDRLTALSGVRECRRHGDTLSLTVSEPHVTLPELLAMLSADGNDLLKLTTRHASLGRHELRKKGGSSAPNEPPLATCLCSQLSFLPALVLLLLSGEK
ncbi:MAG: ABC transporter ATP-binding protein [Planctomycetota bacterium]